MEFKNNFKGKINLEKVKKSCSDFLVSKNRWIIIALALLITGYFCYLWYFFIFRPAWSEERKIQYISQNMKNVTLNSKKYEGVLLEIQKRAERARGEGIKVRDIFHLN